MGIGLQTMFAARIALIPLALVIAAAAFVNAAAENEAMSFGPDTSAHFGLDAHVEGVLVDQAFRAEMARLQEETQAQFPRLSNALIARARGSIAVDPLEVSSLRTVALGNLIQDDEERARRVMRLAERISKRDAVVSLWLAQDYGRGGDADAMAASFDHALRTNIRAREFAMKPVVETLGSEDSYAPLGRLLAQRPEWENAFWGAMARNAVGVTNAANFLEYNSIPVDRIPESSRTILYANLKKALMFDALYRIAALDPGARAGAANLTAGKFVTSDEGNPLGWSLYSEGRFTVRVHQKTGELQIDAKSGSFGLAADRIVRVEQEQGLSISMVAPVPDNATLDLVVRCAEAAKRELVNMRLEPGSRGGELNFGGGGCGFASLELSFTIAPGRRDALVQIGSIALNPT